MAAAASGCHRLTLTQRSKPGSAPLRSQRRAAKLTVEPDAMADTPDRQAVLTTLTTEHFTLQGARSQTVSESSSRASLYLFSVSSALVALGFVTQVSQAGEVFQLFALTVLPTLYFLGLSTFVRPLQSSVEDIVYGRAINRIRHYYLEEAGKDARYFMLGANRGRCPRGRRVPGRVGRRQHALRPPPTRGLGRIRGGDVPLADLRRAGLSKRSSF